MNNGVLSVIIATTGLVLVTGCGNNRDVSYTGTGTFEATEVTVSAEVPGRLVAVNIEEGDTVHRDDVIAEIDDGSLTREKAVTASTLEEITWNGKTIDSEMTVSKEAVAQARTALDNLEKTRTRIENLVEQGAATRDRLDSVLTETDIAKSRLRAAERQLSVLEAKKGTLGATREKIDAQLDLLDYRIGKSRILSPIDGVVLEKLAEAGELAGAGTQVCTIADMNDMWLTIYISEELLGKVKIGGAADIRIDSHPDRRFPGKVTWVADEAEFTPKNVQTRESRADLVYEVRISVDNPEGIFKIGMPAEAYIEGIGNADNNR